MKLSSPSLGFGYRAVACLPAGRQVLLAALRGTAAIPRPSAFDWLFSFGAYVCGSQIRCIYSSGCPTEHPEQRNNKVVTSPMDKIPVNMLAVRLFIIAGNVFGLGEGGDFEDENCLPPLNLIRGTKLHLTIEPPIFCRCCYV
jgi:hypothetical protein